MSLAFSEELQEFLKQRADEANISASKLVRDLIETHLKPGKKITIVEHVPEFVPVILKVPADLVGKKQELSDWFSLRIIGIVERLATRTVNSE